jgi:hypothetical protein
MPMTDPSRTKIEPLLPKSALELDPEKAKELEEKFDSEIVIAHPQAS